MTFVISSHAVKGQLSFSFTYGLETHPTSVDLLNMNQKLKLGFKCQLAVEIDAFGSFFDDSTRKLCRVDSQFNAGARSSSCKFHAVSKIAFSVRSSLNDITVMTQEVILTFAKQSHKGKH